MHLQNERTAVSRQIEDLDRLLAAKHSELNEYITRTPNTQTADSQAPEIQSELLRDLRDKTHKVEELSLKIDELFQIQVNLEALLSKMSRFNQELFQKTFQKLKAGEVSP